MCHRPRKMERNFNVLKVPKAVKIRYNAITQLEYTLNYVNGRLNLTDRPNQPTRTESACVYDRIEPNRGLELIRSGPSSVRWQHCPVQREKEFSQLTTGWVGWLDRCGLPATTPSARKIRIGTCPRCGLL
jgi:hypothetical protein